jgi:HK97 family phage major capsid protein
MTREEIKQERKTIKEALKAGTMAAKDAQARLADLENQERATKQEGIQGPLAEGKSASMRELSEKMKEAMLNKRAVTLNGTELVGNIRTLFEVQLNNDPLLGRVSYFYGPNGNTNIPVLNPHLALPIGYAEGATNVAADTQAQLGVTTLTPRAFASVLPVSAETLSMGLVDLEAELPRLFARVFNKIMHRQILTGTGVSQDFASIITGTKATIAGAAPTIADLATAAVSLRDYFSQGAAIVMDYLTYGVVMADSTPGVAELYKEELIRSKTIEGVPVILTGDFPRYTGASGSCVWVGGPLEQYAVGIASEIKIDPILIPTSTNTFFRAIMFMNGTPIVADNFTSWYIE